MHEGLRERRVRACGVRGEVRLGRVARGRDIAGGAVGLDQAPGGFARQRARGFLAQVGLEPIRGAAEVASFVVRDSSERERGNGGLVPAGKSATNRTESLLGTVDGAGEVSGVAEKQQIAARLATAEGLEVVR